MKPRTQKKVINTRFRHLANLVKAILNGMNMEDVHQFRVEIKRLRAFTRLISVGTEKPVNIPAGLRKAYRRAGILRDLQLHRHSLTESPNKSMPTDYPPDPVDREMLKAEKDLKKCIRRKKLKKVKKTINQSITQKVTRNMIYHFHEKKLSNIQSRSGRRNPSDQALHSIRKDIKDILYNAHIFKEDLHRPFPLPGWDEEQELYYTKLAEWLGQFVDCCVELKQLKKFNVKSSAEQQKQTVALLRKKERLKSEIIRLLQDLRIKLNPEASVKGMVIQFQPDCPGPFPGRKVPS